MRSNHYKSILVLCLGLGTLLVAILFSIRYGVADLTNSTVIDALFHYNSDLQQHQIVHDLRLPRVLAAVMVGAAMAISGAMLQAITDNALAAPEILGINWGVALTILVANLYLPWVPAEWIPIMAFCGGGLTMLLVWGIGSLGSRGTSSVKLALAGVAISALVSTMIEGIILVNSQNAYALSYLIKGSVAGIEWRDIQFLYPWMITGSIAALMLTGKLNLLRLGDEVAKGLGLRVRMIRLVSSIVVVVLAGSAVAVSGPIAFIGLVVPHITRFIVGVDERWVIPCSGVFGALLLVLADLVTRLVFDPEEVSVSILMSIIGATFFIYLLRSRRIT
ncbi:iron ABC transporter permease [Paenibacillus sp. BR2-3]|uniref:FecCD family ABC transporter permease n=1 Tax=Paenibacillus sp. BR2-3 TaxID=3048494 RepID=UPI0039774502